MPNPRFDPTQPKAMDDSDETTGHFMGADTVPDEVRQPVEGEAEGADDDTEGHRYVVNGPEGVADEDDTEGHVRSAYGSEGFRALEPEGFKVAAVADEDDTEGHVIRTRPAPEGSRPMPSGEGVQPHRDDRIV